ncbi:MAG: siphovirus ReqiPepy6 Gp37-like family protein [Anaerovoracaceae bacterium]
MELYIYDRELVLQGVADELYSFIWTRRYSSPGEFAISAPFTETNKKLFKKGNIIKRKGDLEAGEIKYLMIKKNSEGAEEIEIQGKFLSSWLDKRIILEQKIYNATVAEIINSIMKDNFIMPKDDNRKIPLLSLSNESIVIEPINYTPEKNKNCKEVIEELSKNSGLGFMIKTTDKHVFHVYQGRDLTAGQKVNRPCIFSNYSDSVGEQSFENSLENYKSTCYISGEEKEGVDRVTLVVNPETGLDRVEVYEDGSSIKQTYKEGEVEKTLTDAEYRRLLNNRAEEVLSGYYETLNFDSKVTLNDSLVYKKDFDVGDIVTCKNDQWGIRVDTRITEVKEIYQNGEDGIEITFGEGLPTLLEKIEQKIRRR